MKTLLIDGDTIAFLAASVCQHVLENENGYFEPFARRIEGETTVENLLHGLKQRLEADKVMIFLSCNSADNWRLKVDPSYKSNRAKSIRPMLLGPLKNYLRCKHGARHFAYLEADDALGVAATHPTLVPGDKIIVGRDKDFATIPGYHYQLKDNAENGTPIVRHVSPMEARMNHYVQALAGDAVDGYAGCPGFGMKSARKVVEKPTLLIPKPGVVTRGKRKGQKVTRWMEGDECSVWEAIVARYEKEGLSEAQAIKTARLAKILLAENYNLETHEVTLWVPGDD